MTNREADQEENPYEPPQTDASMNLEENLNSFNPSLNPLDMVVIKETPMMRRAGKGVTVTTIITFIFAVVVINYPDNPTLLNLGMILFIVWVICVLTYIIASIIQGGGSTKSS